MASSGGALVSLQPYVLLEFLGLPVTNAMVTSWVISLLLILCVRLAIGRVTLIPARAQAVAEVIIEQAKNILTPLVGAVALDAIFPVILGMFCFIAINNLSSLVPGVGAFGFYDLDGHLRYWLRPGSSDLNMTLALSGISSIVWFYFMLRYEGAWGFIRATFGNKANRSEVPGFIYHPLSLVFFAVGGLELIGLVVRPVSLAFRLFGNVYGGENLLNGMQGVFSWILPVPFYFLELIIGLVQALVFALLVSLYVGLCTNQEHPPAVVKH